MGRDCALLLLSRAEKERGGTSGALPVFVRSERLGDAIEAPRFRAKRESAVPEARQL
jgi:hypothetical protein